jgi:16S rRNA (guanine527-N7)-methyltransferase
MARVVELALGHAPDVALDLGSGGGVPGLVLAEQWPAARIVLCDASERRCRALREAVGELGLAGRVEVVEARGEHLGRDEAYRARFPAVVARAFGPPAVTAEIGGALVAPGGVLVVSEPPVSDRAARWPAEGLAALGLALEEGRRAEAATFAVLRRVGAVPEGVPRRDGIPAKRPRW